MTTKEQIKALEAQLASLKAEVPTKRVGNLTIKIGEKGTVNIYGLGRFPVCLYLSQIEKMSSLLKSEEFEVFLADNSQKLARKE